MPAPVIVVGAGSAGCVVAERLSRDPQRSVVLLEAGDADEANAPDPALRGPNFFAAVATPGRTWDIAAERTPGTPPEPYVRGRGIGGSSAINALITLPGLPGDYDRWAALGCAGWAWRDVWPDLARLAARLRPRHVPPARWGVLDRIVPGAEAAALCVTAAGERRGVADVFLDPEVRRRPNLTVRAGVEVERVCFGAGGRARRAAAVRLTDGREIEAGSVVLTAGAIHSPVVLLRSGVERAGIGANLRDHPSVPFALGLREADRWPGGPVVRTLARFASGPGPDCEEDLQILPIATVGSGPPSPTGAGHELGLVMVALMAVRSAGRIGLRADGSPDIRLGMLTHDEDARRLSVGVRRLLGIVTAAERSGVVDAVWVDDGGTGPNAISGLPDTELVAWMRSHLGDYVHACGTCRMGDADDPDAVVDPSGAVIGVEGLHVADASVFPDIPRANTNLPTILVASRIAERLAGAPAG